MWIRAYTAHLLSIAAARITLLCHADRMKIACLAQLVNVIAPILTSDTGAWRQTIFYPFLHASTMGCGRVLNTTVLSPAYECRITDSAPYLDAVVVEDEENETLTLFAVNQSLEEEMELICDLRQYAHYRMEKHIVLAHEDMKAVNTEDRPDTVIPQGNGISENDRGAFRAVPGPIFGT